MINPSFNIAILSGNQESEIEKRHAIPNKNLFSDGTWMSVWVEILISTIKTGR
jgi:hypothetical protein